MTSLFALNACSGGSAGNDKVGAATVALFSSSSGTATSGVSVGQSKMLSTIVSFFVKDANACAFSALHDGSLLPPATCLAVGGSANGVMRSSSVTPGTYGASSLAITVSADQGCDHDVTNPSAFASFTITAHDFTCSGSSGPDSTVSLLEGSGVWQNNPNTNATDLYGAFRVKSGDRINNLKCTFSILDPTNGAAGQVTGVCEDESGTVIGQSADQICTLN